MKTKLKLLFVFFIICFITKSTFAVRLDEDKVYCNSAVVIDSQTGAILYNKNGDKKVYPASTTKIMTAILAIENLDLNTPITASRNAIYSTPVGSSSIYLQVGEVMSVKNLLYGLLVKSGNEVGNVLGEAVSGSIDEFVDLMNKKAKELGCTNTHFSNPHGFHEDDHYTTANDMAKIMQYCIKNETFRQIVETQSIVLDATNKTATKRYLTNTNKMFDEDYPDMYYEYIVGGKTGFTDEARGTFVGYCSKDNKSIIVSVFDGSQDIYDGNEARFVDTKNLSEYIFDDFVKNDIENKDNLKFEIKDKNTDTKYEIGIKDNISTLSDNENYRLDYNILLNDKINYSDNSTKVGTLEVLAKNSNNDFLFKNNYDLYILGTSEYKYFSIYKYLDKIIIALIILFIFLILLNLILNLKGKKHKTKTKFKDRDLRRINR